MSNEFTYPIYKKNVLSDLVVRFDGPKIGEVVVGDEGSYVGEFSSGWSEHTDGNHWQDWTPQNADNKDNINPTHYKQGGIETIDYMKAKSTTEEFRGHLRLTAIKYLSRYGHKDDTLQELKKAKWYLDKLIEELEE